MKRKYVYVVYNQESQTKLRKWCSDNNFDLTFRHSGIKQNEKDFIFHTTILYSVNESDIKDDIIEISHSNKVHITGLKYLGENLDIPVFTVASPGLDSLRRIYELKGLIDFWGVYLPHISISYSKEVKDLGELTLPDFTLEFDQLIIEDLEE